MCVCVCVFGAEAKSSEYYSNFSFQCFPFGSTLTPHILRHATPPPPPPLPCSWFIIGIVGSRCEMRTVKLSEFVLIWTGIKRTLALTHTHTHSTYRMSLLCSGQYNAGMQGQTRKTCCGKLKIKYTLTHTLDEDRHVHLLHPKISHFPFGLFVVIVVVVVAGLSIHSQVR